MHITRKKILAIAGTGLAVTAAYEIFCPKATLMGRVVTQGSRKKSAVSILFDKTPNPSTEAVCKKLHELQAPATFFIENKRTSIYERAIKFLRPFEMGIHGERYHPLIFKKEFQLRHFIEPVLYKANDIQGRKISYLMPPYGWKNFRLVRVARKLGLKVINPTFKVGPHTHITVDFINRIQPGDIILISWMDGQSKTETVLHQLETLVEGLKERGISIWGLRALL